MQRGSRGKSREPSPPLLDPCSLSLFTPSFSHPPVPLVSPLLLFRLCAIVSGSSVGVPAILFFMNRRMCLFLSIVLASAPSMMHYMAVSLLVLCFPFLLCPSGSFFFRCCKVCSSQWAASLGLPGLGWFSPPRVHNPSLGSEEKNPPFKVPTAPLGEPESVAFLQHPALPLPGRCVSRSCPILGTRSTYTTTGIPRLTFTLCSPT